MTLTKKQQAIAVLLAFFVALSGIVLSGASHPDSVQAATENRDIYTGREGIEINPSVVYTKVLKQTSDSITYYTDSIQTGLVVGQKVKVGFSTDKNQSAASKKVYKKLKKAVKIKSVKWYTKDAKGKIKVVSTKKTLKIPKSVKGKMLYVKCRFTRKGKPRVYVNTEFVGAHYQPEPGKYGEKDAIYEGIAAKGALLVSPYVDKPNVFLGETTTASATSTYIKRIYDKTKPVSDVKYTYQWYKVTENFSAKNVLSYTKISGATKAAFTPTSEGMYAVFVIAKKSGYYSANEVAFVNAVKKTATIDDVHLFTPAAGFQPNVNIDLSSSAGGILNGATLKVEFYLNGVLFDTVTRALTPPVLAKVYYVYGVYATKNLADGDTGKTLTAKATLTLLDGTVTNNGATASKTVISYH